jgi:TonB family protein
MESAAQHWDQSQSSRRGVPRYRVQAPLDVTVLRSGIPDTLPGRSVNLCERGIAAMLAGELALGEAVGVELRLPWIPDPIRARALVRHHDRLRCGLEFVGLTPEQHTAIRVWTERSKAEPDSISPPSPPDGVTQSDASPENSEPPPMPPKPDPKGRGGRSILFLVVIAALLAAFWWRWNRGWNELESGLPNQASSSTEQPRAHVTAEEMQKLLVHKVDPDYPPAARQQNLRGVIALDVVIGRDGAVADVRALNGPEVLARAAVDALRWWKFQPYRLNGQAVVVETTVAVEFKP